MNYNVKRFTRPIKGICECNYDAVKSIGNLANNNFEYRQYNKQFFMKRLGVIMEHIQCDEDCEMIDPVVPEEEPEDPNGAEGADPPAGGSD